MELYVNGIKAQQGMSVETFRQERATLLSWSLPGDRSSGGRVYIKFENGVHGEYFPSVINGEFRNSKD